MRLPAGVDTDSATHLRKPISFLVEYLFANHVDEFCKSRLRNVSMDSPRAFHVVTRIMEANGPMAWMSQGSSVSKKSGERVS